MIPTCRAADDPTVVRRRIADFEAGAIDVASFGHDQHLHMAWLFLRAMPLAEALTRYGGALRRLAGRHGADGKYNETVTWALLFVIHDRLEAGGAAVEWDAFLERNADLRDWKRLLEAYYRSETLSSGTARRTFVFPDRFVEQRP